MFANVSRLVRSFHIPKILPSIEDMEASYLNGSADRYDLECREREISAGKFRRPYFAQYY